jgi:hypothetical protein
MIRRQFGRVSAQGAKGGDKNEPWILVNRRARTKQYPAVAVGLTRSDISSLGAYHDCSCPDERARSAGSLDLTQDSLCGTMTRPASFLADPSNHPSFHSRPDRRRTVGRVRHSLPSLLRSSRPRTHKELPANTRQWDQPIIDKWPLHCILRVSFSAPGRADDETANKQSKGGEEYLGGRHVTSWRRCQCLGHGSEGPSWLPLLLIGS